MNIHKILNKERLNRFAQFMYGEDVSVLYVGVGCKVFRVPTMDGDEDICINKYAFMLSENDTLVVYMGYSEELNLAVFSYRGEDA